MSSIIHVHKNVSCLRAYQQFLARIFNIGSPGSRNITHDGHFCCIWIEIHICFGKRLFFRINNRAIQTIKGRKVWLHQWLKSKHILFIHKNNKCFERKKKTTRVYLYISTTMHKIWKTHKDMNTTFIAALNRLFLFYLFYFE